MPLGPCPETNSGNHKWVVQRKTYGKVDGEGYVYIFRQCRLCRQDDMVVERIPAGGRHRKGKRRRGKA